jgi:hypothetical protein
MPRQRSTAQLRGWIFAEPGPSLPVDPGISAHYPFTFVYEWTWAPPLPDQDGRYTVWLRDPLGWDGYDYLMVGTEATPADPPTAPRFLDGFASPPLELIAWYRQVCVREAAAVLTACWDPTTGLREDEAREAYHLSRAHTAKAQAAIARGWDLLYAPGHRGRPQGTGRFRDAADFRQTLITIIRQLDAHQVTATQNRVMELLDKLRPVPRSDHHSSDRNFRALFKTYIAEPEHIDWRTFREKVRQGN